MCLSLCAISLGNLNVRKFTLCVNNVTRKYWLIADNSNEAKRCGPFFAPCPDFMWEAMAPMPPSSYTPYQLCTRAVQARSYHGTSAVLSWYQRGTISIYILGSYQHDTCVVPAPYQSSSSAVLSHLYQHGTSAVLAWYQLVIAWYQRGTSMVQAGTSMVIARYQHGTSGVLAWYQWDTSVVLAWYQRGTRWYQHGTSAVQACYQLVHCTILLLAGTSMVLARYQNGTSGVLAWYQWGTSVVLAWYYRELAWYQWGTSW